MMILKIIMKRLLPNKMIGVIFDIMRNTRNFRNIRIMIIMKRISRMKKI